MELKDLESIHKGELGYIVGKGASLEFLASRYFIGGTPVICMNESIVVVQALGIDNPLYSLQKDGTPEHMAKPNENVTLLLQKTDGYSGDWFPEHEKRILIDPVTDQNFHHPAVMSIRMCINLARFMGCSFIFLVCCDSLTNGDLRTFDVFSGAAHETSAAVWYQNVHMEVLNDLKGYPHAFITPSKEFAQ